MFYLYAPNVHGAAKMYNKVVEPTMIKIEGMLGKYNKGE